MVGVALIIITLIIAIPVGVLVTGGIASGVVGFFLKDDAEARHEGSELLEIS